MLHKFNKSHSHTAKLTLSVALMLTASASFADEANIAYVDSVHKWGAWEMDIEPAAGGLTPSVTQPLNARDSKVSLRTNSMAALAPPARPGTPVSPIAPPLPVNPIVPTPPTITPISPNIPIPIGGPGLPGGSPTSPTISAINPSVPIPSGGPGT